MKPVRLLGYAPDAAPTIIGVLTNCSGVVPSLKGMKGAPSPASTGFQALSGTCQGAAVLAKLDNSTRFFAGAPTKIFEANGTAWTDVSRASSYTPNSTQRWRFAQFGNVSIATSGNDTVQASASTAFADIAGAPVAGIVETVNQFVFAFNTDVAADAWHCCAIGDHTNWVPSIATQSARGRLTATPGPIVGGRRFGDAIIAYKQKSMYLGFYVGPPVIWGFTQIPGDAGAMSHESIVNIGTPENPKHIFMGSEDFYLYDGAKPIPIGTNRVKVQVFGQLLQSRFYTCSSLHDRKNSLVYFYYPVADSSLPDHCVVYNYRTDSWGVDDRQIEIPVEYVTPGITYDSLGNTYSTYDSLPSLPYDLAFLNPMSFIPAIFDLSHTVKTLTGAAASSSITTGDLGADMDFLTLSRVRPRFLIKPTSATMVNSWRNNLGDSLTADVAVALSSFGTFDSMRDARWHRFMMSFVGDWEMADFLPEFMSSGSE